MNKRIASAALQYSKWLSRFICWIWATYRFLVLLVAAIQPSAAEALGNTISGIDTIMLVNEGTYLVNSLGEKWIYSDKAILSFIKRGGFTNFISKFKKIEEIADNSDDSDEEGSNG